MTTEKISKESHTEALKIAKGTQKPGQTKEQTKLIAHGIEKGIVAYKKQQKVKARERDKFRKKELKAKLQHAEEIPEVQEKTSLPWLTWLPWLLLAASWVYYFTMPLSP